MRKYWFPIIVPLISFIVVGGGNFYISREVNSIEQSYQFIDGEDPRLSKFNEIYQDVFEQEVPPEIKIRIGTNPQMKAASGIYPWINISQPYYNEILKVFNEYKLQENKQGETAKQLKARLQMLLSGMIDHESKHVKNQAEIHPVLRNYLYYARYQLDPGFMRLEEISAVTAQIQGLRKKLDKGEQKNLDDHLLNELLQMAIYTEFAPEFTNIMGTDTKPSIVLQQMQDGMTFDSLGPYFTIYFLRLLTDPGQGKQIHTKLIKVFAELGFTESEQSYLKNNLTVIKEKLEAEGRANKNLKQN